MVIVSVHSSFITSRPLKCALSRASQLVGVSQGEILNDVLSLYLSKLNDPTIAAHLKDHATWLEACRKELTPGRKRKFTERPGTSDVEDFNSAKEKEA